MKLLRGRARALVVGGVLAAAGAGYAHFVGCSTGSCPLTSSVWRMALYGFLVGVLAGWPPRAAD